MRRSIEEESNMIPWEEDIIIYNFVSKMMMMVMVMALLQFYLERRPYLLQKYKSYVANHNHCNQVDHDPFMNDITKMMMMQTRILKNQEGCANTLSMECMDFYHR